MLLLESYEVHTELNPIIWNNNVLKEDVAIKLKEIADEFIEYVEIPLNIVDIQLIGSNASYNYNKDSDIDLHIITNSELSYIDPNILRQLYNLEKNLFNKNYDLKIKDIPVEVYIEDVRDGNATNARYSILDNKWIKEPIYKEVNIPVIDNELDEWSRKCLDALQSSDVQLIQNIINEIYMMRKISLENDGELSVGNLVFKELRNLGLLDDLREKYYELQSKELSLENLRK